MKKVKDYYFKKARKDNYPARSVYKLEEAQNKHGFLKKGDIILDLGCRPGSWSLYAAQAAGTAGKVVGVDLEECGTLYRPGASVIRSIRADIMEEGMTDLLRSFAPFYHVVLSDMAPRTTGNRWVDQQRSLVLARRALELAAGLLHEGGSFYCKVFEGEDFKEFVDSVRKYFTIARIIKPKSSRKESREVFVLAMGYKDSDRIIFR